MTKQRVSALLTSAVVVAAGVAIILHPREISAAVLDSLSLCVNTLLPALFPFFVLSSLVIKLDLFRPLTRCLQRSMETLFHLPGQCASALVLGLIGGYPTGAKMAAELYRNGLCSKEEAENLLSFCNNCGPAFLFGAVGCGIFGGVEYGLLLTGVHDTAALLTGVLLNRCGGRTHLIHPRYAARPTSLAAAFVDSVTGAMGAMLNLCSFVLCFGAITRLITLSGLPRLAADLCLPFLTPQAGEALMLGLLEMTHGVTSLSDETLPVRLILTAALLGWGGVSVHCQVLGLLRDTDLSPRKYLQGKLLHSIISALLMWGVLYHVDLTCLAAGGVLLVLPRICCKKSSGKSAKGIV